MGAMIKSCAGHIKFYRKSKSSPAKAIYNTTVNTEKPEYEGTLSPLYSLTIILSTVVVSGLILVIHATRWRQKTESVPSQGLLYKGTEQDSVKVIEM